MNSKRFFFAIFVFFCFTQSVFAKTVLELTSLVKSTAESKSLAVSSSLDIKFIIDDVASFSEFGIDSIDICTEDYQCERLMLLSADIQDASAGQLHYHVPVVSPGIRGGLLKFNRQNRFQMTSYLEKYQLDVPESLVFDLGVRYELVIDLERVSEKYYKPYYISFDRVVPVDSQVAVVSSDRECTLSAPHAGFDVVVPQGAVSDNTIMGIAYDRRDLNTGILRISPDKALSLPATIFITFDQPELLYGDESVLYSVTYNASEVDLDYHGQSQNGRPVYMLKVKETGVLSITEKNPFEKIRFRPVTDVGHRFFKRS